MPVWLAAASADWRFREIPQIVRVVESERRWSLSQQIRFIFTIFQAIFFHTVEFANNLEEEKIK